jgi:CheY-specific phosphatase CheX
VRSVSSAEVSAPAIRLRVGYHSAQSLIAEYTARLASRSCLLATRKAVDPGAIFVFEMYCPDHETPVELEAEVVRARPIYGTSVTYELAMQYRASRAGQAALEGLLRRIEIDRSYAKVRAFPRIPVNLSAEDAGGEHRGYVVRDLSQGGMLLECQAAGRGMQRGARALLGVSFAEQEPLVFLPGTVRWNRANPVDGSVQLGVAFSNLDTLTGVQRGTLDFLTRLTRPHQLLVHLTDHGGRTRPLGAAPRRAELHNVIAAIARQELAVALGISVLDEPVAELFRGESYQARVGLVGRLRGEIALTASLELCAAIAAQIAGDKVALDDVPAIMDGLREFVVSLGGSLCDRLETQGIDVSLTEPLLGEAPPRDLRDEVHAFAMRGARGSAVFQVVVRSDAER